MSRQGVVVGAGMGGLTAATRLAQLGFRVRVLEAREEPGGLASSFEKEGFFFDAGPYVLLDRLGLEWAFGRLGLKLEECVALKRIEGVYEVLSDEGGSLKFYASLEQTAANLERIWPGSGPRYVCFVRSVERIYQRLQPLLYVPRPGLSDLLRRGLWRQAPFLLRSLQSVLEGTGLPSPVQDAIAIWTHVAGQSVREAPSPMAFVPALIHTIGAFYPVGGMETIPRALARAADAAGVEFQYGTKVRAIRCERSRVCGIETDRGEFLPADAVISNAGGVGTYLELVKPTPSRVREQLRRLPLQSPGVCAYLAVRGEIPPPYLRFYLPGGDGPCRLFVAPATLVPELNRDGWQPARLLAPMDHAVAERVGPSGQRAYLDRLLAEDWWRRPVTDVRVLAKRIPSEWGAEYHLYRQSMNPVMTAHLLRAGRLAHRSPYVRGLYLSGSSTHPGQWMSFCAISGILAADRVREDLLGC